MGFPTKADAIQLHSGPSSARDVLVFNHNPLAGRMFAGIYASIIGAFPLYQLFFGQGLADGWLIPGAFLWLLIGAAIFRHVEELRLDFSQRVYELRTGSLPDLVIETGSFDDFDCLRLGWGCHPGGRHSGPYHYVNLKILWKRNHPVGLTGKGFQLKDSPPHAEPELMAYGEHLGSRLQVPVVDKVPGWLGDIGSAVITLGLSKADQLTESTQAGR